MMKLKGSIYLWFIGLAVCAIAACNPNSADLPVAQPVNGMVSFFNLIPNGSAINLYVNGTRVNSNKIAFDEYSGYISVPSGEQAILFKDDFSRSNLFDPVRPVLAKDYTSIFVTGNSASNLIYTRDTALVDTKNIKPKLRFVNAAANLPACDVVLKSVTISNTAYKGISAFARVDTGLITVNAKLPGNAAVILKKDVRLLPNTVYTLFIYGSYTAQLNNLKFGIIAN